MRLSRWTIWKPKLARPACRGAWRPRCARNGPHQILVRASCEGGAEDALLGAATTRALVIARQKPGVPALVYAECAPGTPPAWAR